MIHPVACRFGQLYAELPEGRQAIVVGGPAFREFSLTRTTPHDVLFVGSTATGLDPSQTVYFDGDDARKFIGQYADWEAKLRELRQQANADLQQMICQFAARCSKA